MSPVLITQTKPVVLVVDDLGANRELVEAHLADLKLTGEARDGQPPVVNGGIL